MLLIFIDLILFAFTADPVDPPKPFWKVQKIYGANGEHEQVYYYGKIYEAKWWTQGDKPDLGGAWTLIGDAEWTVPEDPANYEGNDDDRFDPDDIKEGVLSDEKIEALWDGIDSRYLPEAAVNRLQSIIPETVYEDMFPCRMGTDHWKETVSRDGSGSGYPNYQSIIDYYSYDNLREAVRTLSNIKVRVQWYDETPGVFRWTVLFKDTKKQALIYTDPDFEASWQSNKTLLETISDYGSFLAEGSETDLKRELAGFLANVAHETGGGNIQSGTWKLDESQTGLYWNEEVGLINTTTPHYVSPDTNWPAAEGRSYHGRGPIQLSYNYNYGPCSKVIFGDKDVLLKSPEFVCGNTPDAGVLGWQTGIWFWMTPQPPKPSCHEAILGTWKPGPSAHNTQYNGSFGLTIVVINAEAGREISRRGRMYQSFTKQMGLDIGSEKIDTVGMVNF